MVAHASSSFPNFIRERTAPKLRFARDSMLRRLIQSPIRRRITLAVLAVIVALALSIKSVHTRFLNYPGLCVLFRGRAVAAVYHRPDVRSYCIRVYWMEQEGAIHDVVCASVGGVTFLQFGPDNTDWCGTGR